MVSPYICVLFLLNYVLALHPPNYIKPCSLSDPNLKKCALESAKIAEPTFVKGDDKFGLPNLFPFKMPHITVLDTDHLQLEFDNLEASGLPDAEILEVDIDPNKMTMRIRSKIDRIQFIADYNIHGKILILPIEGQGKANITAVDGIYEYNVKFEKFQKDGINYGRIINDSLEFVKLGKVYMDFANLFNGDETLKKQMDQFVDENWEALVDELGGAIRQTVSNVCRLVLGNFMKIIPFDELFLP